MFTGAFSADYKEEMQDQEEKQANNETTKEAPPLRMLSLSAPPVKYYAPGGDESDDDDFDGQVAKLRKKMIRLHGGEKMWNTWEEMYERLHEEYGEDVHGELAYLKQQKWMFDDVLRTLVQDRMDDLWQAKVERERMQKKAGGRKKR